MLDPETFSFYVVSSNPAQAGTTETMDISVFASVIVPGFGIIAATHFDSADVIVSVPEPCSVLLVSGGLLLLNFKGRRTARRQR